MKSTSWKVAVVQQLLVLQKNIVSVLSAECIIVWSLSQAAFIESEQIYYFVCVTYYDGFSQKIFLTQVRSGLQVIKKRQHKANGRRCQRQLQCQQQTQKQQERDEETNDSLEDLLPTHFIKTNELLSNNKF
ncbi:hypothetical protein DOY81_008298 [Sarcophaga bullata]|nr:hypothetical protein DOY81_008298 [Sarcophaga bullata]